MEVAQKHCLKSLFLYSRLSFYLINRDYYNLLQKLSPKQTFVPSVRHPAVLNSPGYRPTDPYDQGLSTILPLLIQIICLLNNELNNDRLCGDVAFKVMRLISKDLDDIENRSFVQSSVHYFGLKPISIFARIFFTLPFICILVYCYFLGDRMCVSKSISYHIDFPNP